MKIVEIKDDYIKFNNGYKLQAYHEQDCCENVYADFKVLKDYNVSTKTGKSINIFDVEFNENLDDLIWGVKDQGFNMISAICEKFFVPCYNEQNGYYSSNLELVLYKNKTKERMDISNYVVDRFY